MKGRPTLLSPANIKALTYGLMNIVSARCGRAGGGQESNEGMQQLVGYLGRCKRGCTAQRGGEAQGCTCGHVNHHLSPCIAPREA